MVVIDTESVSHARMFCAHSLVHSLGLPTMQLEFIDGKIV